MSMVWPTMPPEDTDPWYTPFLAAWAAAKVYIDNGLSGKAATSHSHSYDPAGSGAAAQAAAVQRSNHTGTQTMSTISDAGNAATKNVGTGAGTVAAGDDARFGTAGAMYGYFDPRAYGAAMDGSTDDVIAIGLAVTALNAAGRGVLKISGQTTSSTKHTITVPATLMGDGAGARLKSATAPSCVKFTSGTNTGFDFTDPGSRAVNIAVTHTAFNESTLGVTGSAPTAGFGLRFGDTTGSSGDGTQVVDCLVQGFYTNVDIDNATEFLARGSQFWAPVHTNVRLRNTTETDFGDASFESCWLIPVRSYANAAYNMRWGSGGGLKLLGCKFNGGAAFAPYGCTLSHVSLDAGTGTSTSIFVSEGTSYENYELYAIDIVVTGTGTFDYVSIIGGEVAPYNSGGHGIRVRGRSGHILRNVNILGVNLVGAGGGAVPITLDYVNSALLANTETGWSTVNAITNSTSVRNAGAPATTSAPGLLPALGGGTSNFLRADGTWALPSGGATFSGARVYTSAVGGQNIASATDTPITWSTEVYDTDGYWSVSAPPRFTATTAGYYRLTGMIQFTGTLTEVYLYPSASDSSAEGGRLGNYRVPPVTEPSLNVDTGVFYMAVDEYISLNVYVSSGVSVRVEYDASFVCFQKVG